MRSLQHLPDDILFIIFQHLISTVEELIRLETVCKRIREICLSRRCWIDALEMLENRPPFMASRASLLGLSAADLREKIVRGVKLDRSWKSEGGPLITEEEIDIRPKKHRYDRLLPLPEVDLVFASNGWRGVHYWSISQKSIIRELNILHTTFSHGLPRWIEFDCDVSDDHSTALVALVFNDAQDESWYVQVHQLDARTFNCELLFESPPMSEVIYGGELGIIYRQLRIRNHCVALLATISIRSEFRDTLIIMNWKEKSFFRINNEPVSANDYQSTDLRIPRQLCLPITQNTEFSSSIALTQDVIFFINPISPVGIVTSRIDRLVGIRYGNLAGNSASIPKDWTTYEFLDLKERGVYSDMILERERPPSNVLRSQSCLLGMTAVVTAWSKTPTTRLTVTFKENDGSSDNTWISIFDVAFTIDGNGHGSFKVIHLYSKVLMLMTFLSTPSLAMRAVIRLLRMKRAATFSAIVNDSEVEGGIVEMTRKGAKGRKGIDVWNVGMDPLGRVMVYQEDSKQNIGIIRFD